ncbi:hypothetical protein ACTG9Q_07780 [Actinokineospora sp. 24-640]
MRINPGPTRRAVLLGLAVGALAGCTAPEPPPPPDPLADLVARAHSDAAMASAVAAAVPSLAGKANEVAKARAEHAGALRAEMERERPPVPSSASPAPTTAAPAAPTVPKDALKVLTDGLTAAEKQAAALIAGVPRYRAGLVGSVAASCASLREVL